MATAHHPSWPLPIAVDEYVDRLEQQLVQRVDEAVAAHAEYRRLLAVVAELCTVEHLGAETLRTLVELIEARAARLIADVRPGCQS